MAFAGRDTLLKHRIWNTYIFNWLELPVTWHVDQHYFLYHAAYGVDFPLLSINKYMSCNHDPSLIPTFNSPTSHVSYLLSHFYICILRWLASPPKLPSLTLFGTSDFSSPPDAPLSTGDCDFNFPNADLTFAVTEEVDSLVPVPAARGFFIIDSVVVFDSKEVRGDMLDIFLWDEWYMEEEEEEKALERIDWRSSKSKSWK